jgi:hypothetical protein
MNELEKMWKKVVMAQFLVLPQHLPRWIEQKQKNSV